MMGRISRALSFGASKKHKVCLHRENIVLNRNSSETMSFVLDGEKNDVKTYGVVASIIDLHIFEDQNSSFVRW
ncbi:hypothetical protein L2E82_22834 [Cichorium intybus]|uniref:Uncharacterized protein n=1 Tax=Cichorium intybus TaxID=13427 RepID=A0ACB9DZI1_CICIN|nr:hypothetical protein L2E82_22834 [Cichorium intybus]